MIRTLAVSAVLIATACVGTPQASAPSTSFAMAAPPQAAQCHVMDGKADRRCTPGALNLNVTQATVYQTICVKGWTTTIRPPASYTDALKRKQMVQYGETGPISLYKEDHVVPLEAGGDPTDPHNLFPQPDAAAHLKDQDENATQRDICAGRITLKQGQDRLLAKWVHP